jgi:hypothetical protein
VVGARKRVTDAAQMLALLEDWAVNRPPFKLLSDINGSPVEDAQESKKIQMNFCHQSADLNDDVNF